MSVAGQAYLKWYYDALLWKELSYRGVRILKLPLDLWNYQEIFQLHSIEWVVETGTRHGGSALYFADLLAARSSPGRVISIDVEHTSLQVQPADHAKLLLLRGDSAASAMVSEVKRLLPERRGAMFLILDSDHRKQHVLRELNAYVPLMQRGDYLIVEDTCVNGHPVRPDFGPGPMEAIDEFLAANPGLLRADVEREEKFGCTFAPRGHFVRV